MPLRGFPGPRAPSQGSSPPVTATFSGAQSSQRSIWKRWQPHYCHLPPPCTTQGKPYEPQRYQRWHQSSWHREWHLPAGGNVQFSPPGPCGCSEKKRGAGVNSEAAQVLACPLLLDADLQGEETGQVLSRKGVCAWEKLLVVSKCSPKI